MKSARRPGKDFTLANVRRRYARHLLYDLSRPEASLILLAPLAKAAGGYESCGRAVFATRADDDYGKVLVGIAEAGRKLAAIKRFDMPGFRPRPEYLREMRRFGILPADTADDARLDVYQLDQRYWRSLWYRPLPDGTTSK